MNQEEHNLAGQDSADQEIPDRATANAAKWLSEQGVEFDTPTFWLVAGLLAAFAQAEIASLQKELELTQRVIAWANNSLYGSHGFFLSANGGVPDEHHLDSQIEKIKLQAKAEWNRAEKAKAELASARRAEREQCVKDVCVYCCDGIRLEGIIHRDSGGLFVGLCRSVRIHERAQAEGQISNSQKGETTMKYDIEAISAKVHERWMESKRAKGVTSRKLESDEELMVPYSELSEEAKDLDRGSVKEVIAAIESL